MNRKAILQAAALLTLLGSACPLCETSCVSSEAAPMPDGDRALADLFARSAAAPVTPAMEREWESLRARYQESLRAHGPSPLLADARLSGSATLAASPAARERFVQGMKHVESLARRGRSPDAREMAALQRLLVGDTASARLRVTGERATAGAASERAYLSGAFVEREIERVFATPAAELAAPVAAAQVDQKIISIHPYVDGNGRVARLVSDWLLLREGYPPVVPSASAALHAAHDGSADVAPSAHLERVTAGMRNAVAIAELDAVSRRTA